MYRSTTLALTGLSACLVLAASACKGQSRNADGYLTSTNASLPQEPFIPTTETATSLPVKRTAPSHPIDYYISVPKGWPGKRAWPIVLNIVGSGRDYPVGAQQFADARNNGGFPFIVVTPITLTNSGDGPVRRDHPKYNYPTATWDLIDQIGRCAFDLKGIRAVLEDVQQHFSGDSKLFLTGFSGGGNTGWAAVLLEPEVMRGAALTASNFAGRCVTEENLSGMQISSAPERVNLPIRAFNGENDDFRPMGTKQQQQAMDLARANGFTNMSFEIVPKFGHDPMPKNVLSYFNSLLPVQAR